VKRRIRILIRKLFPIPEYPVLASGVTAIAWRGRRLKRLLRMSRSEADDGAATLQSA
jgi:hypothetical protein